MKGLEKRFIWPYGNAVVASRAFAPGDVVIHERPMLTTTECNELLNDVYSAHNDLGIRADLLGKDASIDFTLQMLQYCAAGQELRSFVLELFIPDPIQYAHEPYVRAAVQYASQLTDATRAQPEVVARSVLSYITAQCDAEEVIRVVLAWVCNSYSTQDGGGALYKLGSLVNHCCEGNTRYRFLADMGEGGGFGVFVAVRPIQPGDVITTCYLGWDEQTLLSTRMRQKLLTKTKLFTCTCARCTRPLDPYRALPCPHCVWGVRCEPGETAAISSSANATSNMGSGISAGAAACLSSGNEDCVQGPAAPSSCARPSPTNAGPGGERDVPIKGRSGFVYWNCDISADRSPLGSGARSGGGGTGEPRVEPTPRPQSQSRSFWECDTCGRRYGAYEMQHELRRRAASAGRGREVASDDPELALEEEVHGVGEQLDWFDLAVSIGAVRQLGARCQAVLGQRHWTTNRCRYTVLELCTAALMRTCTASRTAASAYSGDIGQRPQGSSIDGDSCRSSSMAAGGGAGGTAWCAGNGSNRRGESSFGDRAAAAVGPATVPGRTNHGITTGEAAGWGPDDIDPSGAAGGAAVAPLDGSPQRGCGGKNDSTGGSVRVAIGDCGSTGARGIGGTVRSVVSSTGAKHDHRGAAGGTAGMDCGAPYAGEVKPASDAQFSVPELPLPDNSAGASVEKPSALLTCATAVEVAAAGGPSEEEGDASNIAFSSKTCVLASMQSSPQHSHAHQPGALSVGANEAADSSFAESPDDVEADGVDPSPQPNVNPHLGRAELLQHTLHHHNLHQREQLRLRQRQPQQQQEEQQAPPVAKMSAAMGLDMCGLVAFKVSGVSPCLDCHDGDGAAAVRPKGQVHELAVEIDQHAAATAGGAVAAASSVESSLPGEAGAPVLPALLLVSEASAVRSVGGSTLWSLLEVDGMVDCICDELQALWQWQQLHTPDEPAVVLKAVAGPAATALMEVVKDELCSGGALAIRALAIAEATAARLVAAYAAAPFYDVSGEAYEEAVTVVQLCPLIRSALDLPNPAASEELQVPQLQQQPHRAAE